MPRPVATRGADGVEFGIHIGPRGCMTNRANIMRLGTRAEALGYDILGVADHVIAPISTQNGTIGTAGTGGVAGRGTYDEVGVFGAFKF